MSGTENGGAVLHAVANLLAEGRRVLVLGDSFELVEQLAGAAVKELVVVTALADPDAPAGSTANGAPLRLRADWAERQNSKDLVVDPAGEAPAAEVARVLKKQGIYLTGNADALALALLTERREVGGPRVYLAGTVKPPDVLLPASEVSKTSEAPADNSAEVFDLQAQIAAGAERIAALEAQLAEQAEQLAFQHQALDAAEALGRRTLELEDALAAAEAAAERQRAAARVAEAEHAEQAKAFAKEFDQVRAELAERRVADRRIDAVKARFEKARLEMVQEIEGLRAQIREYGEPAEDAATLVGERDEARRAHDEVTEVVEVGVRELGAALPNAPAAYAGDGPRTAWLHAVRHALGVAAAELGRLRHRRVELEAQVEGLWIALRERDEALAAVEDTTPAAPADPASIALDEGALEQQLQALQAALVAERQIRSAESQAWRARVQSAEAALTDRRRLLDELARARQEAARARLRIAAGEEQQRRLSAERLLRDERITDLEVMLATHTRMQSLLSEALAEAEAGREEAEADRRLVESNLRLLERELAERS